MHLIYVDDSGDESVYGYAGVAVPEDRFRSVLTEIKTFRRALRESDGIFINKELHAWKLVSGRGRLGSKTVTKGRRCQVFREALSLVGELEGVRVFLGFGPRKQRLLLLNRLINRINRTMQKWGSRAMLIFDEGEEKAYTRLVRKMGVYNPIPSKYGLWMPEGMPYRNMPVEQIIEDPSFRRSEQSYLIQMADLCGYALLQHERPTQRGLKYGLNTTIQLIETVIVRETNPSDPLGVVRIPKELEGLS